MRRASRERRDLRRQELRQAILDAAADLFLAEGYERFSMRQVAERMSSTPARIGRLDEGPAPQGRPIAVGEPANLCLVDAAAPPARLITRP